MPFLVLFCEYGSRRLVIDVCFFLNRFKQFLRQEAEGEEARAGAGEEEGDL